MSRNKQRPSYRRPNHQVQAPARSASPDKRTAPEPPGRGLKRKRTILALLVLVGLFAVLEYAARLHDGKVQFRFQLLKALDMPRSVPTPLAAGSDAELGWPPDSVFVRDPGFNPPPEQPYVCGGKTIPEARPDARQFALMPDPAVPHKQIFIIGESAAFGFPLGYSDSFAAHLEQALQKEGRDVINASEPGWYSGILVPAAHRIIDLFKPEALVIYMGNNEWIHWFPPEQAPDARLFQAARFLAGSRAIAFVEYRVVRWLVNRSHSRFDSQRELTGFDYALKHTLDQPPANWESVQRSFLANFESNLLNIISYAKARNVRVVLMTVPFCYKLSPAWKHPQPLAFSPTNQTLVQQALDQASAAYRATNYVLALEKLEPALAREPSVALLHYLKAATLEAQGKLAEAEHSYAASRDKMIGNLGSILSVNQTIRKVAASTGTALVDLPILFEQYGHQQGRYFNDDLIIDDCHPTPLGHRLIAQALLPLLSTNPPAASLSAGARPNTALSSGPQP